MLLNHQPTSNQLIAIDLGHPLIILSAFAVALIKKCIDRNKLPRPHVSVEERD